MNEVPRSVTIATALQYFSMNSFLQFFNDALRYELLVPGRRHVLLAELARRTLYDRSICVCVWPNAG
jgi:hypothetical protein